MIVHPIAKINLGLNVVERRPDGYHNLETVFYPVPLCDTLEVDVVDECVPALGGVPIEGGGATAVEPSCTPAGVPIEGGGATAVESSCVPAGVPIEGGGATAVEPSCTPAGVPIEGGGATAVEPSCTLTLGGVPIEGDPRRNLVVRAYDLLRSDFPQIGAVRASLLKVIPTQAGMGGGSSDCAAMLMALNDLFHLHLTEQQLIGYAARLGADCPFFILGRPAYAEGIGERLQPLELSLQGYWLAVVRPDIPVSTKEAFSLIRPQRPLKNCRDIVSQPVATWRNELFNDFEQSVFALHPEIAAIKAQLYDLGAEYAAMSGSGSAVFGIFRKKPESPLQPPPKGGRLSLVTTLPL